MTFVTPEGAAVTIEGQTPAEPGVFVLENGTYSYSVSKQGYNTATGSVTVNGESQRVDVNLGVETFSVTFNVTTPGAKITVTDAAGETIQPTAENANVYSLPNGEYHYIVSKLGCTERDRRLHRRGRGADRRHHRAGRCAAVHRHADLHR